MLRAYTSPYQRARGFTLLEVIMTVVLLGIVAALGAGFMGESVRTYVAGHDLMEIDWQGRSALERMTRELRMVRSNSAADLNIATAGQIRFNDKNGNAVCFYLAGTLLMRSADFAGACGSTNAQVLASGVSTLGFSYLQNDAVTVAATPAQVRYITGQFTVSLAGANTNYRATVGLR
jgi:prepilin-type N-terminal cleavage/methylation domain-containing protein